MAYRTICQELCDSTTEVVARAEDARILQSLIGEQNMTSEELAAREEVQSLAYVANRGQHCPVCNRDTLVAEQVLSQPDGNFARDVLCTTCRTQFAEHFTLAGLSQVQPGTSCQLGWTASPLERAVSTMRQRYPQTEVMPLFRELMATSLKAQLTAAQLHHQLAIRLQQLRDEVGCMASCLLQALLPATYDWHQDVQRAVTELVGPQDELLVDSHAMFDVDIDKECIGDPYADLQVSYRYTLPHASADSFAAAIQQDTGVTQ